MKLHQLLENDDADDLMASYGSVSADLTAALKTGSGSLIKQAVENVAATYSIPLYQLKKLPSWKGGASFKVVLGEFIPGEPPTSGAIGAVRHNWNEYEQAERARRRRYIEGLDLIRSIIEKALKQVNPKATLVGVESHDRYPRQFIITYGLPKKS